MGYISLYLTFLLVKGVSSSGTFFSIEGDEMSKHCRQCGAVLLGESTCQTIHEELLSVEALNAVAHSIHFLHVTSFLIQADSQALSHFA